MVAGEEYVAALQACESDRRARQAFQDLVLRTAAPDRCIFDFGAGPGIDARLYAAQGLQVVAYDVDPRMCASFSRNCRDEIECGRVHLCEGGYREFLERIPALRKRYDIGLVTANFAPLCLVEDLRELFAGLHALTGPGARLVASVLNPSYIGDLRYGWWWANRLSYWSRGYFSVAGADMPVYRRSRRNFAALAAPDFALEDVLRGLPDGAGSSASGGSAGGLLTSRYLFMVFARR